MILFVYDSVADMIDPARWLPAPLLYLSCVVLFAMKFLPWMTVNIVDGTRKKRQRIRLIETNVYMSPGERQAPKHSLLQSSGISGSHLSNKTIMLNLQ